MCLADDVISHPSPSARAGYLVCGIAQMSVYLLPDPRARRSALWHRSVPTNKDDSGQSGFLFSKYVNVALRLLPTKVSVSSNVFRRCVLSLELFRYLIPKPHRKAIVICSVAAAGYTKSIRNKLSE